MASVLDIVVVGAGQAAAEFALTLRKHGYGGRIDVFGREAYAPYERPPLSKKWLQQDETAERLFLRGPDTYATHDISLHTGVAVSRLDGPSRQVELSDRSRIAFGLCVLATGARARIPTIPGIERSGVHVLRGIADAAGLRTALKPGARVVILGGGYLGLEAAATATSKGCAVTVIEAETRLLGRSLSPVMARALQARHEREGVVFRFETLCRSVDGEQKVTGVTCSDGNQYPADVVLIAIGAEPEIDLAAAAGITCQNGILVDAHCRTSCADVFAIGDCANQLHPFYARYLRLESVQNALFHARTAAASIAGRDLPAVRAPTFWSNQYDLKLQLAGVPSPNIPCVDTMSKDPKGGLVVHRRQNDRLAVVETLNAPTSFLLGQRELSRPEHAIEETVKVLS